MSTGLLFEHDEMVAAFVFEHYTGGLTAKYDRAIGLVSTEGVLVGGVLFQNFNGANVELSYYGVNTMTVGVIRCLWRFAICTFDLSRLTVTTSKRNRQFIRGLKKLGFKPEGVQRCYYGKRDCTRNTGIRLVMFRERIEQIAKMVNPAVGAVTHAAHGAPGVLRAGLH